MSQKRSTRGCCALPWSVASISEEEDIILQCVLRMMLVVVRLCQWVNRRPCTAVGRVTTNASENRRNDDRHNVVLTTRKGVKVPPASGLMASLCFTLLNGYDVLLLYLVVYTYVL
jgi:hypothetical protein